jgi:hypothetical protein
LLSASWGGSPTWDKKNPAAEFFLFEATSNPQCTRSPLCEGNGPKEQDCMSVHKDMCYNSAQC